MQPVVGTLISLAMIQDNADHSVKGCVDTHIRLSAGVTFEWPWKVIGIFEKSLDLEHFMDNAIQFVLVFSKGFTSVS